MYGSYHVLCKARQTVIFAKKCEESRPLLGSTFLSHFFSVDELKFF